jgi:hypothetical protein
VPPRAGAGAGERGRASSNQVIARPCRSGRSPAALSGFRDRRSIVRCCASVSTISPMNGGIHTTPADTDGAVLIFEDYLDGGKATPLHQHPDADETFIMLDGEIRLRVGNDDRELSAGAIAVIPRGVPHAFLVSTETDAVPADARQRDAFYRGASEPTTQAGAGRLGRPRRLRPRRSIRSADAGNRDPGSAAPLSGSFRLTGWQHRRGGSQARSRVRQHGVARHARAAAGRGVRPAGRRG